MLPVAFPVGYNLVAYPSWLRLVVVRPCLSLVFPCYSCCFSGYLFLHIYIYGMFLFFVLSFVFFSLSTYRWAAVVCMLCLSYSAPWHAIAMCTPFKALRLLCDHRACILYRHKNYSIVNHKPNLAVRPTRCTTLTQRYLHVKPSWLVILRELPIILLQTTWYGETEKKQNIIGNQSR